MNRTQVSILTIVLASSICLLGNAPTLPANDSIPAGIDLSEIGVPGGWMGQNTAKLKEAIELKGAEVAECGGDSKCLRITYRSEWGWAGIYWWPTACDKEKWPAVESGSCAIDLRKGPDSRPIERLTFSARGATGGETITFGVGGDNVHPKKVQETVKLESIWKTYEIDLKGVDLKKVTGLFFWSASELYNSSGFVVYLKDVRFTGAR